VLNVSIMSGAAANSAARRRRGGAQAPVAPQRPGQSNQTNQVLTQNKAPINPMELLLLHDKKLFGIEQYLENATHGLASKDELGTKSSENIVASNVVSSTLIADVSLLKERVSRLEDGAPTFSAPNSNSSGLDTNRVEKLEQELVELKKLLLKVQTFSMETNLTLMKIKEQQNVKNTKLESAPINELSIVSDVEAELQNIEEVTKEVTKDVTNEEQDVVHGITFSRSEKLDV
jgi:hypothetical protein